MAGHWCALLHQNVVEQRKKRTKTLQTGLNVWQERGMKGKTVNVGKPVTSVLLRIL